MAMIAHAAPAVRADIPTDDAFVPMTLGASTEADDYRPSLDITSYNPTPEELAYEMGHAMGLDGERKPGTSDLMPTAGEYMARLQGWTDGSWERREYLAWLEKFQDERMRDAFREPGEDWPAEELARVMVPRREYD